MEFVDSVALNPTFRSEMVAVKSTQQAFSDEVLCAGGGGSEEFFVDDLFDFSNEDVQGLIKQEVEEEEEEKSDTQLVISQENSNSTTIKNDFMAVPVPNSELGVPADDLANLEWLSHFVEDSFKSECFLYNYNRETITYKTQNKKISVSSSSSSLTLSNRNSMAMETQVPAKARSKRTRILGSKAWSFGGSLCTESSSSPSSSTSSSSSSSSCLIFADTGLNQDSFCCLVKSPHKKKHQKKAKKPVLETNPQRRCSHCLVQKTPQWRTGPLGSKTLCNACGVRYKSGRLFPEYRPAGSPTFSTDCHSNSHRRVLEMRRKKELARPDSGSFPVQSF